MGMATDDSGAEHHCEPTLDTSCEIRGLRCGSTYQASLIASNGMCNTSRSAVVSVETGTVQSNHACILTNHTHIDPKHTNFTTRMYEALVQTESHT